MLGYPKLYGLARALTIALFSDCTDTTIHLQHCTLDGISSQPNKVIYMA